MEELKKIAAEKAVEYVKDGMVIGLGTGSTAYYAIKKIAELVNDGMEIIGIPTSEQTKRIANDFKIPLGDLNEHPVVDLTIDGADEVDKNLNLIKGGGGALLREKLIASLSRTEIIIVDERKVVEKLGKNFPLPVEVIKFGHLAIAKKIEKLGCIAKLRRKNENTFTTDNGNYIYDLKFELIDDPKELDRKINEIVGVVENGLFVGLASKVIVAYKDGTVKIMGI